MKQRLLLLLALTMAASNLFAQSPNFHSYSAATIEGDTISMGQFYGKKILVVNTASYCGFTPQFADLEQLYTQYSQYNFLILGFPCNDFNNQDPHADSTIADFCHSNYNVTFQMMSKVHTVSGDTSAIYKWLQRADLNGVQNATVTWNFNKFLIDEAGNWVRHFESATNPLDTAITNWILSPSVLPSGIAEQATQPTALYPNPTTGVFTLQTPAPATVEIISLTGKKVFSGNVLGKTTIDLTGQAAGIYFYAVSNKTGIQRGRFIIE